MAYALLMVAAGSLLPALLLFAATFAIAEASTVRLSGFARLAGFLFVWAATIAGILTTGPTLAEPHEAVLLVVPLGASVVAFLIAKRLDQGAGPQHPQPRRSAPAQAAQSPSRAASSEAPAYTVRPTAEGRFQVVDADGVMVELLSDQESAAQRAETLNRMTAGQSAQDFKGVDKSDGGQASRSRSAGPSPSDDARTSTKLLLTSLVLLILVLPMIPWDRIRDSKPADTDSSPPAAESHTPDASSEGPSRENGRTSTPESSLIERAGKVHSHVRPAVVEVLGGQLVGNGVALGPYYVVTAKHVVGDHKRVALRSHKGKAEGRVVATDEATDLALIKAPVSRNMNIPDYYDETSNKFLGSGNPKKGAPAFVVGPPDTVFYGNIRHTYEKDGVQWVTASINIKKGASGGPLVSKNGGLLGIVIGYRDAGERIAQAVSVEEAIELSRRYAHQAAASGDL